jgi:signal peptidase II
MNDYQPLSARKAPVTPALLGEKMVLLLVTAVVLPLDQFSKQIIEAHLPLYTSWAPWPAVSHLFQFTHATNTGAAFGIFPGGSLLFTILATLVSLFILYYNHILPGRQRGVRFALGLQLGGAIGNLLDRLRLGHVTDFLDVGPWPIFNVADMAIVGGVAVLAGLMVQEWWAETRQEGKTDDTELIDEWSTH